MSFYFRVLKALFGIEKSSL